MATLYLDNFRGFSKTIIPLDHVNFLIGENSTGKSSVLALVNLLCSPDFWFIQNFNSPDYEFGGFRDILSATAQDKSHFTIGFCHKARDRETRTNVSQCYVLSYEEREALPMLAFVARTDGRKLFVMRAVKGKFRFRVDNIPDDWKEKDPDPLFGLLMRERERDLNTFQDLPKSIPLKPGFPPFLGMLDFLGKEERTNDAKISFPFPIPTADLVWFAPIRTRPKRTYDGYGQPFNSEGEHTPYLLRRQLTADKPTEFRKAIEAFGKASGLYHKVIINRLGEDAASPFELLVELAPKCPLRVNSVGYGVSQVLPLVVEMIARRKRSWFAIQQPEVHLHPRAQAALGDLIYQVAELNEKRFLVETHSDFTVDRFRMNFRQNKEHKTTAQVLFFKRTSIGNEVSIIKIDPNGEYPEDQPPAFREFFVKEQLSLLGA